ncbi:HD domain-containing phosphohydrolase [Thalassolituus sp. LLYu03]|uniref:HD domain-containing phosphohydrolase n=1 Tax=Thalassolituus sp. LLYu03 TaxID=3421656 RepID=UPI003D2D2B7E
MLSEGYAEREREKHGRLLIVDDEEAVLQALRRLFHRQYDVVTHTSGAAALEQLKTESFDMIISDMRMPAMTGAELLKNCFELYPAMIRVLLTGYSDLESAIKAVNEGNIYRYISKPWDNDQLRALVAEAIDTRDLKSANEKLNARIVEQNQELERLNRELQVKYQEKSNQAGQAEEKLADAYRSLRQEFNSMVHILVGIMERRNGEEKGSSEKLARLAKEFAEFAGLQGQQIQDVYYATLLKNIGKVQLPDTVLDKSIAQMSTGEKQEFARFTINGQTTLMLLEPLQHAANIIRSHMELFNGKGFPDKLVGEAIPKEARILRIVSDYAEIQREHNFLGEALDEETARAYLLKMAGQRYDRQLVDVFMEVLNEYESDVGSNSERIPIHDARVGMVLSGNLFSPAGVVLLSEGTELTERHVAKLQAIQRQYEGHEMRLHVRHEKHGDKK